MLHLQNEQKSFTKEELEKLLSSSNKCFELYQLIVESNERIIDRIERNASYVLSFFGVIVPVFTIFNRNASVAFLESKFFLVYLFLYLFIVLGAIVALFPKRIHRNNILRFSIPTKSDKDIKEDYIKKLLDYDRETILDVNNKFLVQKHISSNEIAVIGETCAKLSYLCLILLFIYFFIDLSRQYAPNLFWLFSLPEVWAMTIVVPPFVCLWLGIREWTKLKRGS